MVDWIDPKLTFTIRQVKGTSGGAKDKLEYLFEAEPNSDSATAVWRGRRFIYDSAGFMTQVLWCDGDRKFDNVADNYLTLSYS